MRALAADSDLCTVVNNPALGRKKGLPTVTAAVESEHVFALLRGRGVKAFAATVDPVSRLLLPQRGMHGDPELPTTAPATHRLLAHFRDRLASRSSYRRFQKGRPWWSLWSTGPYTFSPFKVVWKELSGGRFAAAYVGSHEDPVLGRRLVVPAHKLYFVRLESEAAAAYLCGLLNAPMVARAVSAYAAQLSLGASVVAYLAIPAWNPKNRVHSDIAALSKLVTRRGDGPSGAELMRLDALSGELFGAVFRDAPGRDAQRTNKAWP